MTAAAGGAPRGWRALVLDRTFGSLFWGKLLSSAGVWMQGVVAAIVIYDSTGSATAVSLVSIAQSVPQLVLGPWSGSLADRADPARQILVGRLLCVLGSALLAGFFLVAGPDGGGPRLLVTVAFACSLLIGSGFVLGGAAMQSVIADVVRPDELRTAMALNTAPMTTARVAGPALGALVLGWAGPATAFAVSAATHAVFVLLLVLVARMPGRPDTAAGESGSMRAGLSYLRARPRLVAMLAGTAVLGIGTEPTLTLAPALSSALTGGVSVSGHLTLAFGFGALLGLVLTPVLERRATLSRSAVAGLLVMVVGLGLTPAWLVTAWAYGCFMLAGIGFAWGMAGFSALLQTESDRTYRGRVMAWWLVAFLGCRPLSSSLTGVLTDLTSVRVAFGALAVSLLVATVLLARTLARRPPPSLVAPVTNV